MFYNLLENWILAFPANTKDFVAIATFFPSSNSLFNNKYKIAYN